MFIHLCKTCGNIAQKMEADFEHVCHICHQTIVKVVDLVTGETVTVDSTGDAEATAKAEAEATAKAEAEAKAQADAAGDAPHA